MLISVLKLAEINIMMKVEVKKLDKLKRTIRVEAGGEEFLKEKKESYRRNSKHLKVPGFRPGNIPADVLEKHHGKFLKEEFLKSALPLFYRKALEENKILPASMPRIYDIEITSDILTFFAEFEVRPQVEIDENFYKNIKISDKKFEVKKEEIEKILTSLKEGIKKTINKDIEDNELAKWASHSGIDSLREAIKGQLFVEKLRERRLKIDGQIREHLLKAVKIDVPKGEVDRQHKELVNREIHNLTSRGVSQEDLDKYRKDLEDKLKPVAEDEIKLFYIFEAIARKEGIKIDDNLGNVVLGFVLSQAQYQ